MNKHLLIFIVAGGIAGAISFWMAASGQDSTIVPMVIGLGFGVPLVLIIQALRKNKTVAVADRDVAARARSDDPAAGSAAVFVYRNQFVGKLVGTDLTVDGKMMGQLRGKRFYRLDLTAGEHQLTTGIPGGAVASLTLALAAGTRTYVRESFSMGMTSGKTVLAVVPEATGTRAVARCKLLIPAAIAPQNLAHA